MICLFMCKVGETHYLINEFRKITEYIVNIQNSAYFFILATDN